MRDEFVPCNENQILFACSVHNIVAVFILFYYCISVSPFGIYITIKQNIEDTQGIQE